MLSLPTRWGLFLASWLPIWGIWGLFALVAGSSASVVFALVVGIGIMTLVTFFQDIVPGNPRVMGKVRLCKCQDRNVLSYAGWYLLPFLITPLSGWIQAIVVIGTIGFVGMLYVQGDCITINPVLLLLGFHFYDVQLEGDNRSCLLLTRRSVYVGAELQMAQVGDLLVTM